MSSYNSSVNQTLDCNRYTHVRLRSLVETHSSGKLYKREGREEGGGGRGRGVVMERISAWVSVDTLLSPASTSSFLISGICISVRCEMTTYITVAWTRHVRGSY